MAYRLKQVEYSDRSCHILLQNDNGPCPLIAAANALLLRGAVSLRPAIKRANVISTDDLVHLLADWALHRTTASKSSDNSSPHDNQQYAVSELMESLPKLQYGLDVNPKFTSGPGGAEVRGGLLVSF